jgi:hypothetical protein
MVPAQLRELRFQVRLLFSPLSGALLNVGPERCKFLFYLLEVSGKTSEMLRR